MVCFRLQYQSLHFSNLISFRLWSVDGPARPNGSFEEHSLYQVLKICPHLEMCSFVSREWWRKACSWTVEVGPCRFGVGPHHFYGQVLFGTPNKPSRYDYGGNELIDLAHDGELLLDLCQKDEHVAFLDLDCVEAPS